MTPWFKRLWCLLRRRPVIHTMKLPKADGWLANHILDTLSRWHRQSTERTHMDMMILTSEDIKALAEWAAELQKTRAKTVWWAPLWRMNVKELPTPIHTPRL